MHWRGRCNCTAGWDLSNPTSRALPHVLIFTPFLALLTQTLGVIVSTTKLAAGPRVRFVCKPIENCSADGTGSRPASREMYTYVAMPKKDVRRRASILLIQIHHGDFTKFCVERQPEYGGAEFCMWTSGYKHQQAGWLAG
jgi:hypothetical protein